MRPSDQTPPAIPPHAIPPGQPSAAWPTAPIVGLEYLPLADLWDDVDPTVTWDTDVVWDAPGTASGFSDVWCDTAGLEIVHGEPDESELTAPSVCRLTLYDPAGRYRRRTADGRMVNYAAGRRLCVLAFDTDQLWLFSGYVATFRELPADDMLELVAYSSTAKLAADPGRSWAPGSPGQTLGPRATAIVAAAAVPGLVLRTDAGGNTLVRPPADPTPALELLQRAAWSDGGIVYADADDTLIVRDRLWRNGRTDQPTPATILTDTECDTPGAVIVWDPEIAHDDEWLAGTVRLSTDAGLTATYANPSTQIDPSLTYTHPDTDLWTLQGEGDNLAAWIAALRGVSRMALGLARVYLHDRRQTVDTWRRVLDVRLGDQLRWLHRDDWPDGESITVDVTAIAATVRHLITPEQWIVELETTPAVVFTPVAVWNFTTYRWNDADPAADWR